jgi:hypothetical protein
MQYRMHVGNCGHVFKLELKSCTSKQAVEYLQPVRQGALASAWVSTVRTKAGRIGLLPGIAAAFWLRLLSCVRVNTPRQPDTGAAYGTCPPCLILRLCWCQGHSPAHSDVDAQAASLS